MNESLSGYEIESDDYRVYCEQIEPLLSNESFTLVFLHDSWGCVGMWGDFPLTICRLLHLSGFAYDRRGYGKSSAFAISQRDEFYLHHEAYQLIKILDTADIQNVVLYGHSDGATIALIAASLFPSRVKGLILEGPHSFIEDSGKAAVLETRERARETNLLMSLEKYHGSKTSELFRLWHETWLSDYFAQWSIVDLLKNIQCPVLAFQGENDEFGSVAQLEILRKEIKTAVTIHEIPNAAHTPRKEAAKLTLDMIKDWYTTTYKS